MARSKPSGVTRTQVFVRAQDQSAFSRRLLELVGDEITDELDERVGDLEDEVAGLSSGDVGVAEVELQAHVSGGTVYAEPEDGFAESAIGQPIIVVQGPTDSDEFEIVQFTAEVIDRQRMRIHWSAPASSVRRVRPIHFLIG